MEYEELYKSLWGTTVLEPEVLTKILGMNVSQVTNNQWHGSLAVAVSLQDSQPWIAFISQHVSISSSQMFQTICRSCVVPYFQPKDPDGWKQHPECLRTFHWILNRLDGQIKPNIGLITPVVVRLLEDFQADYKLEGLQALDSLLDQCHDEFLCRSGVAGVIEQSLRGCLVFRDGNVKLLDRGFAEYGRLLRYMYRDSKRREYTEAWWRLTERLLKVHVYLDGHVMAHRVIYSQVEVICRALGVAVARHLRGLVGILADGLRSCPADLSVEIRDMHLLIVRQFEVLLDALKGASILQKYHESIRAALVYSQETTDSLELKQLIDNVLLCVE